MKLIEELFSVKGKTVLITGGNSGLGLEYAKVFAMGGANLVIAHIDDNVAEVTKIAKENHVKLVLSKGDLREQKSIDQFIEKAKNNFSTLDILINNAGINLRSPILEFPRPQWDAVLDVNLNAVFFISQAVAQVMKKQEHGKIINVGSLRSFQAGSTSAAYAASKHGVIGITKAFANELSRFNIQVNAIAPGYFYSAQTTGYTNNPEEMNKRTARIPIARWGVAADLAGTIIYLASKASDYVTGTIAVVDGGYLIR